MQVTKIPGIESLPITPYLSDICAALRSSPSRFLVLTAQTAAGKSTAVPVALLQAFSGSIVPAVPASYLQLHLNAVFILDEDAAQEIG